MAAIARSPGANPAELVLRLGGKVALGVPEEGRGERARPHEAHVSPQDVDELWDLVESRSPKECSDGRDTGVRGAGPKWPNLIGTGVHGPELQLRERCSVSAYPLLAEEDGPTVLKPDRHGYCNPKQRQDGKQQNVGCHQDTQVKGSLKAAVVVPWHS